MYVCICNSITDKEIKQEVVNGANCFSCIRNKLGLGNCCGKCMVIAEEITIQTIKQHLKDPNCLVNNLN